MATRKNILVIQPPGPHRESILTLLYHHLPDTADSPETGLRLMQQATDQNKPYDAIFLGGLATADMAHVIRSMEADSLHQHSEIIACIDDMKELEVITSPNLSVTKKNPRTGWNLDSMLRSMLAAQRLA